MNLWLTIVLAGLATFAIRLSFIALLGRGAPQSSRTPLPYAKLARESGLPEARNMTRGTEAGLPPASESDGMPDWVRRALRFVPTAVLCAIIFPALLLSEGRLSLGPGNARLVAGLAAIAVAWFSRNVVLTIASGMLVLVALLALGS